MGFMFAAALVLSQPLSARADGPISVQPSMTVQENGRGLRCHIISAWTLPNGLRAYLGASSGDGRIPDARPGQSLERFPSTRFGPHADLPLGQEQHLARRSAHSAFHTDRRPDSRPARQQQGNHHLVGRSFYPVPAEARRAEPRSISAGSGSDGCDAAEQIRSEFAHPAELRSLPGSEFGAEQAGSEFPHSAELCTLPGSGSDGCDAAEQIRSEFHLSELHTLPGSGSDGYAAAEQAGSELRTLPGSGSDGCDAAEQARSEFAHT